MKVVELYEFYPVSVKELPDDDIILTYTNDDGWVDIYLRKNQVLHLKRCKNGILHFRTKVEVERGGTFEARVTILVEDGKINKYSVGWVALEDIS